MTEYENVEEMTFEQSIDALEALVKRLEDGGIDLDESLRIYEQAVALRDHCRSILEDGERRIRKIMETADGSVREEEFEIN
ncbi:MAG: exodeoxyribonuclease VII small subunit [Methanomassiliicoccales archaeon Mx-03]|nr:exodeoxyribonuclease VII small subunit [Methanomassiliicoccaceae archaeon DOK]TQS79889.1 MAG: exodeoxyribonuclease VII small subunit [Methanomassiliicoccales archaeon Mx-03]